MSGPEVRDTGSTVKQGGIPLHMEVGRTDGWLDRGLFGWVD